MPERDFVEADGEQIHFESWGDGDNTVVLGHGLCGSHAVWYQQVAFLAQNDRVVTWDQREFGRSTAVTEHIGPAAAVRDMERLFDHLGISEATLLDSRCVAGLHSGSLSSIPTASSL